jgi:endonuclease/exonuclease/phosphatase family metal-dependent hydrolase
MYRSLLLLTLVFFYSCTTSETVIDSSPVSVSVSEWESIKTPEWYNSADVDTISILAWNIEHFVDDYDSPYIDHPRENNPDENLPERRRLLADALKQIDADIVVFQEVESSAYIAAFAEEYFEELGYQLFTGRESDTWYMNVIVMSRIPLGMLYSYSNIYTFRREVDGEIEYQNHTNNRMVSVDVLVHPEYSFLLTGVHLKAGRSETDRRWRMGQIDVLKDHYRQTLTFNPDGRILLAGDLNIITGDPEYHYLLFGENGTDFIDPLGDTDSFTHPADAPTRQLDYILPNSNMAQDLVPGSKQILTPFDSEAMRLISDHLPVFARFVTR